MESERKEKRCPFCAELILVAAKKCRYCGSVIENDESFGLQHPTAVSRLRITREAQYSGGVRAFRVLLDGVFIGKITTGDSIEVEVAPGQHEVVVEITTIGTLQGKIGIMVSPGQTKFLRTAIKTGIFKNTLVVEETVG
jgi:hypothetical protein